MKDIMLKMIDMFDEFVFEEGAYLCKSKNKEDRTAEDEDHLNNLWKMLKTLEELKSEVSNMEEGN